MSVRTVKCNTDRTNSRRWINVMSAITETQPGDESERVCILEFSAGHRSRDPETISRSSSWRSFHVGERVRYVTFYYKDTPPDNPTGYMAVFEPLRSKHKNRYAATQDYFVSLDCWEGLRKHFASTQRAAVRAISDVVQTKTVSSKRVTAKIIAKPVLPRAGSAPNRGKGVRKNA